MEGPESGESGKLTPPLPHYTAEIITHGSKENKWMTTKKLKDPPQETN
jgi:hypothetical protein